MKDRRRHPRRAAGDSGWTRMRLRTGDLLSIVDIGAGGVLVESDRRLLPGTAVVVQLASDDRLMRLDARVLRCVVHALKPDGGVTYRGALEFVSERDATRNAVSAPRVVQRAALP